MSMMYDCMSSCLCANCKKIEVNCAECRYAIDRIKECFATGIKECKYFEPNLKEVYNAKIKRS